MYKKLQKIHGKNNVKNLYLIKLVLYCVNVNVKIYKKDKIKLYNRSKLVSKFKKSFFNLYEEPTIFIT